MLIRKSALAFVASRRFSYSGVSGCVGAAPCRMASVLVFPKDPSGPPLDSRNLRFFQTASAYHKAADETLETIQDAIDGALEEKGIPDYEVTVASGVLTLVFPPHGTWVINKQTPNQQLWWSSPISGPRRYEYEHGEWVYTRDDAHSMTLTQALQEEIRQIYDVDVDL